jgi:hypothetical protein
LAVLGRYAFDTVLARCYAVGRNSRSPLTRNFLKTLIDIPEDDYGSLTVVSPLLRKVFRTEKSGVFDLKLSTKSGKIIHIELQVEKRVIQRLKT